jgi:hypothetical protein
VGTPGGKRTLQRSRSIWEDNIQMDHQEVRRGGAEWMELAQDRDKLWALVCTVKSLRVR